MNIKQWILPQCELMKSDMKLILSISGVHSILLVSSQGRMAHLFLPQDNENNNNAGVLSYGDIFPNYIDWTAWIQSMSGIGEVEVHYEKVKCYIRKWGADYLIVIMATSVPMGIVRLNCELLYPPGNEEQRAFS